MHDPNPIELEALAAIEARELEARARVVEAEHRIEELLATVAPIRPDVELAQSFGFELLAPESFLVAVPTLPAVIAEVDLLVDELLAVDLELAAWRADLERVIR